MVDCHHQNASEKFENEYKQDHNERHVTAVLACNMFGRIYPAPLRLPAGNTFLSQWREQVKALHEC